MSVLKIQNLSKRFGINEFYSLKGVDLEVCAGEIVGVVGRNGAGKSTLLKMIAKSYIPTSGTIEYNGKNIFEKDYILENMGIMIEPVFYSYMTVEENLKFYLEVHGKKEFEKNIDYILELVDLSKKRKSKPATFSFGMKQRLSLAIVLVDEPEFLILDEPFVGLDPYGVNELLKILQIWAKERNVSMLISSHQLSELESICDRFVMIEGGEIKDIQSKGRKIAEYFKEGR